MTKVSIPDKITDGMLVEMLHEESQRHKFNKLSDYRPHPKQAEFHKAGAVHNERLFMAANQSGKTLAGGMEIACHMTGRYPDWWEGAVFERPGRFWVSGVTGESTRDNPQRILIGAPELRSEYGSGCIPKDALDTYTMSRGTPNLMDSFVVRFGGGGDTQQGRSMVLLKSYEKGREKWQGDTVDAVWFDEEPPPDIYSEGKTRTNKGQRSVFVFTTFTPLNGMSEVVRSFLTDDQVKKERMH